MLGPFQAGPGGARNFPSATEICPEPLGAIGGSRWTLGPLGANPTITSKQCWRSGGREPRPTSRHSTLRQFKI
eukprot:4217513-Alexandrium_andersonii.AAC.1